MGRNSWLDDSGDIKLDEQVQRLEHFTASLKDGVVDSDELSKQQDLLVSAMKAVESELSDEQHAKVTTLLLELSAYNVMNTLHELAGERARRAFNG